MWKKLQTALATLDLEERILNGATLGAVVFLFFPWLSGQFLGGDPVSYSGMQFYVSYIGGALLILHVVVLLVTFLPIVGGPAIVKRPWRAVTRLVAALYAFLQWQEERRKQTMDLFHHPEDVTHAPVPQPEIRTQPVPPPPPPPPPLQPEDHNLRL